MAALPWMPDIGWVAHDFDIDRLDYAAPEAGGRIGGVTAGWPKWGLTVDLAAMLTADADIWRAFQRGRRGAQRWFVGTDISRPFPAAHRHGFHRMVRLDGSAFDGSAFGWEQSIVDEDAMLTLHDVPSGLILGVGDYVGFKWDAAGSDAGTYDRRTLASVVRGGVADADGSVTVAIEPPVPTNVVPPAAIAHLDRAACIMKMSPDTKMARHVLGDYTEAGSKIVAVQDLRA